MRVDRQSLPGAVPWLATTTHPRIITVSSGQAFTGVLFGFVQDPSNATIGGRVFNDITGNGIFDGSDAGFSGINVQLTWAGIDDLFGWVIDSAASSVFDGIVSWMARGLAVLIEWIWSTLDTATTPRITEPWFTTDLMGPISMLALAVVIALMLASAIQAALAGRPEQILDAFKQGAWSIVATALSITVIDLRFLPERLRLRLDPAALPDHDT